MTYYMYLATRNAKNMRMTVKSGETATSCTVDNDRENGKKMGRKKRNAIPVASLEESAKNVDEIIFNE